MAPEYLHYEHWCFPLKYKIKYPQQQLPIFLSQPVDQQFGKTFQSWLLKSLNIQFYFCKSISLGLLVFFSWTNLSHKLCEFFFYSVVGSVKFYCCFCWPAGRWPTPNSLVIWHCIVIDTYVPAYGIVYIFVPKVALCLQSLAKWAKLVLHKRFDHTQRTLFSHPVYSCLSCQSWLLVMWTL